MKKEPVLVVMAAGMGSRYGGLKQIDPVGSASGSVSVSAKEVTARPAITTIASTKDSKTDHVLRFFFIEFPPFIFGA